MHPYEWANPPTRTEVTRTVTTQASTPPSTTLRSWHILYLTAGILLVLAIPHAIWVYTVQSSSGFLILNVNLVLCAGLSGWRCEHNASQKSQPPDDDDGLFDIDKRLQDRN